MENPNNLYILHFARALLPKAYKFAGALPRDEEYNFKPQIRRAAKSCVDNIREGASRQSDRAFLPFLYDVNGSASELVGHFRDALDLKIGDQRTAKRLKLEYGRLQVMTSRLIRSKEARLERNPRRSRSPRRTR
jgi:four helix bundle protein